MGNSHGTNAKEWDELFEYQQHTHFTISEMKAIREKFEEFTSASASHKLNRTQFRMAMEELEFGQVSPDAHSELFSHLFSAFDVNGDDEIDFRTFVASLSVLSRGTLEERIEFAFNVYDQQHTGVISRDDMLTVLASLQTTLECVSPMHRSPRPGMAPPMSPGFPSPRAADGVALMENDDATWHVDADLAAYVDDAFAEAAEAAGGPVEVLTFEQFRTAMLSHPRLLSLNDELRLTEDAGAARPVHYLVCVDGSENADRAFDHIQCMLNGTHHRVSVVSVVPPLQVANVALHTNATSKEQSRVIARYKALIQTYKARASNVEGHIIVATPEEKDIATLLQQHAEKHAVDCIVIGCGKNSIRRCSLGQTLQDLCVHAHCSVLIVK